MDNFARLADVTVESEGAFQALPLELREFPDRYVLWVDAPGIKREDVEVSMEGNALTVKLNRPQPEQEKDARLLYGGRWYGSAARTINLPFAASSGEVNAKLAEGVLTIEVTKQPEKQAKRIAIN